jgi:hypothetical protein
LFIIPLGSSLCGRIENDPNMSDNRSSVDSEVDLLKDYKPRSPIEENKDKEVKYLIHHAHKSYQKKLSQSSIIEDHDSIY